MIDKRGSRLRYSDNGDIYRMNQVREKARELAFHRDPYGFRGGAGFTDDFDQYGEKHLWGRDLETYRAIKSRCK